MKRPVGFVLLTIVAATLTSMVVYSSLRQKQAELERARAALTPIVVAAHDLALGSRIDGSAVKLAGWPHDALPPGALVDARAVVGRIAKADFVQNQPIVSSRVISPEETSGVLPLMIPKQLRAMSVMVDEAADMAGFILPYTRVDVLLTDTGRAKIILENVQVLAVAQTLERKDQPQPEKIVTLLVSPDQAERLALAEGEGKLHLALRSYGDNDVIVTRGSNLAKVMAGFNPEDIVYLHPIQQATPFRLPHRRLFRPQQVEVMRNGHRSEIVRTGAYGRPLGRRFLAPVEPDQAAEAAPPDNDFASNSGTTDGDDKDAGPGMTSDDGTAVGVGLPGGAGGTP